MTSTPPRRDLPPSGNTRAEPSPAGADPLDPEHLKETGKQLASRATEQVKAKASELAEEKKVQATGMLEAVARALRQAGGSLDGEGLEPIGRIVDQGASRVEELSSRLRDRDLDGMLRDLRNVAHRHPQAFIGGAILAGFVAGRFLRVSSRPEREVVFEPDFDTDGGSSYTGAAGSLESSGQGRLQAPPGGWA